jgi:hypothetical protein
MEIKNIIKTNDADYDPINPYDEQSEKDAPEETANLIF